MPAAHSSTPVARLGRALVVLAVCASLGLHWAALQAIAWTQMLVAYSQQASLEEAVEMTFNGEHPCTLCQLVKHGQSEEKKHEIAPLAKKLDAVLVREEAVPVQVSRLVGFPFHAQRFAGWREAPPVPPPRA